DHVIDPTHEGGGHACSVREYGDPVVVEPRSEFVLIVTGCPVPVMNREFVMRSVWLLASVYWNTGLKKPLSAGVPVTASVDELSVSPEARRPLTCWPVYACVPPITRSVCAYATPSAPFSRKPVCSIGDTFIGKVPVAVAPPASVTVS